MASEVASEASSARWALLARWSFRRALRLRPAHPETLHNLGEFLEQGGDSQRAVLSFGRAVDAAPHNYLHRLTLTRTLTTDPDPGPDPDPDPKPNPNPNPNQVDAAPANYLHRLSLGENLQRRCRVAEAFVQYQRAALLAPHSSRVQAHARLTHPETDAVHAEPPGAAPGGAAAEAEAGAGVEAGGVAVVGPPSLADLVVSHTDLGWEGRALRVLQTHGAVVVRRLLNRSARVTRSPTSTHTPQSCRHPHPHVRSLRPPPSCLLPPASSLQPARCAPPCSSRLRAGPRAARAPRGVPGSAR